MLLLWLMILWRLQILQQQNNYMEYKEQFGVPIAELPGGVPLEQPLSTHDDGGDTLPLPYELPEETQARAALIRAKKNAYFLSMIQDVPSTSVFEKKMRLVEAKNKGVQWSIRSGIELLNPWSHFRRELEDTKSVQGACLATLSAVLSPVLSTPLAMSRFQDGISDWFSVRKEFKELLQERQQGKKYDVVDGGKGKVVAV